MQDGGGTMQDGGGGGGEGKAQANGGGDGDQSQPRTQSQTIAAAAAPHGGHHHHHHQHHHPHPHPPPPPPWIPATAVMHHHPAATIVVPHHMMAAAAPPGVAQFPPPPPSPRLLPYVHYQQLYHPVGGGGSDDNKTIWVGDLLYWMDENYLHSCFAHTGEVVSIKVIRNKQTGQSEGYGFVEFYSHATAEKVLHSYNGIPMLNTDMVFRLNWASFSMGERRNDACSDHSIFVGDLASDVTDSLLQDTFASRYASVKGAKVVVDASTGRSKGYGFVRFGDDNEKVRAMSEMNGVYCSSRAMRIGAATPRKSSGGFSSNGSHSDGDSTNTTVFVGGLDPSASEEDLRHAFSQYGEIASVKIPVGKQCGFVQFIHRSNAEEALQRLNGTVIGKQTVRLSWGRNPANKQRADPSHQWNNAYYGGPIYNGYGYFFPPHDPRMYYAAAYGAYPIYGSQQQVS